jgi:hypothetical protein
MLHTSRTQDKKLACHIPLTHYPCTPMLGPGEPIRYSGSPEEDPCVDPNSLTQQTDTL